MEEVSTTYRFLLYWFIELTLGTGTYIRLHHDIFLDDMTFEVAQSLIV
jgi:hypothetical protein